MKNMQQKPEDKKRLVIIQMPNTLFSLPITPSIYTYNPTHELEERKIKFSVVLSTSLKLVTQGMTTCIDFVLSYINSLRHSISGDLQYLTVQAKQLSFRGISWQRQVSTLILNMCSLCYGEGPLLETSFQNLFMALFHDSRFESSYGIVLESHKSDRHFSTFR